MRRLGSPSWTQLVRRLVALAGTALVAFGVAVGAASGLAAQESSVVDRIADGSYEGTISDTQYQEDFPVVDRRALMVKSGDSVEISWSVVFERTVLETGCTWTNRDAWSSTSIEPSAVSTQLRVRGVRTFEPGDQCPGAPGEPSEFDTSYLFTLTGNDLQGDIGVGTLTFTVDLVGSGSDPAGPDTAGAGTASGQDPASAGAGDDPIEIGDGPGDGSDDQVESGGSADDVDERADGIDDTTGDGGTDPTVVVGAVAAGALLLGGVVVGSRRTKARGAEGSIPADPVLANGGDDSREDSSDERRATVVLELTYPAGHSPKVFTNGWLFGARCIVEPGTAHQQDYSGAVRWDGSATFVPAVGPQSRPQFSGPGHNTIRLSVDVDGVTHTTTVTVEAVPTAGYARLGDISLCRSCAHGCLACPHLDSRGAILTGSPTVMIGELPAARVGDYGSHAPGCCANNVFHVTGGDPTVLIDGKPAAYLGSQTTHCAGFPGSLVTAHQHGQPSDWLT